MKPESEAHSMDRLFVNKIKQNELEPIFLLKCRRSVYSTETSLRM